MDPIAPLDPGPLDPGRLHALDPGPLGLPDLSPLDPGPLPQRPGAVDADGSPHPLGEEEYHFHTIYQEFIDTKRQCGEPTESLTFEKFITKLRANRDSLQQRFQCRAVRFQVYVKEGKAALKATPVRE